MTLPLIAVDIGNSATKIGWAFVAAGPAGMPMPGKTLRFATGQRPSSELFSSLPAEPGSWQIVSVHREGARLLTEWLAAHRAEDEVRRLTFRDLPIIVRVAAPERVGLDRLAAAVAANALRQPDRPAIVVGAGSAITVNLVSQDGAFQGGSILPGFRMSAEALYTADLLPMALLQPQAEPPPVLGQDTDAAIKSGLFWGAVGAVREIVTKMTVQLAAVPDIFVTGGDLRQLAPHLGPNARFVPNMVLSGIALAAQRR